MTTSTAAKDTEKEKKNKKLEVKIAFNGINDSFEYKEDQEAEKIRKKALDHYGIKGPARDENFLFGPDNQTELKDDQSMGSQVAPDSQLYLRPRAAGGGNR